MRRRLTLTVLAVTTMVAAAFAIPLALLVRTAAEDRAISSADQEARTLAGVLGAVDDPAATAAVVDQVNATSRHEVAVRLADGAVLGPSIPLPARRIEQARDGLAFTFTDDERRVAVSPVRTSDGSVSVAVVSTDLDELHRGVTGAWVTIVALGVLIVVLGMVLADRLGRSSVRAIEQLGAVTRRLRQGDTDARVAISGPMEVADVGRAVNELADRIDELLAQERESFADISHRLRTPLMALQLRAEAIGDDDDRASVTAAVNQLAADVDAVIHAVRRTTPGPHHPDTTDLAATVERRLAFWRLLARQQHREVAWRHNGAPVWVGLPADELTAAVDALLTNVFQHTPEGTPFAVAVEAGTHRHHLVVEDEGPGIEATQAGRGTSGAGSTGLGLDIARQAATAGGGDLQVGSCTRGGARVTLRFQPVATTP